MRAERQNLQMQLVFGPEAKGEARSAATRGPKPARRVPNPNTRRLGGLATIEVRYAA